MFVAVLSPYPDEITSAFVVSGDEWQVFQRIEDVTEADFVVSYGHRHVIGEPYLSRFGSQLLNLHISFLPWNRGADCNFWSLVDDTPKGVTIHVVKQGLDTGPILIQREVALSGTLATSYAQLRDAMSELFLSAWPKIRTGELKPRPQEKNAGSYHRSSDKTDLWAKLSNGFNTPIEEVLALGRQKRSAGWTSPL
jgi:methionyl-tRNA formyltransferase